MCVYELMENWLLWKLEIEGREEDGRDGRKNGGKREGMEGREKE